jgi:sterol desaturase/sphingolipid hydroxylase (fatty acid hydroxylase superfamily)
MDWFTRFCATAAHALSDAFLGLAAPAAFFLALALIIRRRQLIADISRVAAETRLNIMLIAVNVVAAGPLIAIVSVGLSKLITDHNLALPAAVWTSVPATIAIFAAVFIGDFVGYWRHRLEHSRLLWPSHAVHHSDTQMTWLSLERFHPINRLTTFAIDSAALAMTGLPPYAIVASGLVRHYYGYFIHSDLPLTYGALGRIFVSPAMHRWHHALDERAMNKNFATVFSVFDQAFGTFYLPGPCRVPLGVSEPMGRGLIAQLVYPFRTSAYRTNSETQSLAAPPPARRSASGA